MQLLEVKGLKKYFPIKKGFFNETISYVKAVNESILRSIPAKLWD